MARYVWQLDSFLVDAVRFLHVDTVQIEKSNPLLKITRLAFQFCQESDQLTDETKLLSQRLFSFRDSEVEYLFDWARGLSQSSRPSLDDPDELQRDLRELLVRLNELMFTLADQEGVRARLACSTNPLKVCFQDSVIRYPSSVIRHPSSVSFCYILCYTHP